MSTIINKAKEIVEVNGMSDKITLLQGKMEEVELPFPEVDIIISEWMGYFLLYESMLDTVLWARDRYLRKDGQGLIFPDKATIFMAGIEDGEYKDEKIGCTSTNATIPYSTRPELTLHRSLGQRLRLQLRPPQSHRPHRTPGRHRRTQSRRYRPRRRPHPRPLHLHHRRPSLHPPLQHASPPHRLHPRPDRLVRHRVLRLPQARALQHGAPYQVHALEADGVLFAGCVDGGGGGAGQGCVGV